MRAATTVSQSPPEAERQLRAFIAKFAPKQLAYDNYNFLVIGYGPTERPSDCIVSMAAAANGVGLCFLRGATLPDPKRLLLGAGKQTRFLRLPTADVLARPELEALIAAAIAQGQTPLPASGRGRVIISKLKTQD